MSLSHKVYAKYSAGEAIIVAVLIVFASAGIFFVAQLWRDFFYGVLRLLNACDPRKDLTSGRDAAAIFGAAALGTLAVAVLAVFIVKSTMNSGGWLRADEDGQTQV